MDEHKKIHIVIFASGTGTNAQKIIDRFRNSALHADYYRRIGINHVMALPLRIDDANVISVVFNRSRADFQDHERAVLERQVRRMLNDPRSDALISNFAAQWLQLGAKFLTTNSIEPYAVDALVAVGVSWTWVVLLLVAGHLWWNRAVQKITIHGG